MTKLITDEQRAQLLANGRRSIEDDGFDPHPVVKLFTPDAGATWLLTELDSEEIAFGLCDLGQGFPELGYVSLTELEGLRGNCGLPIERDLHFMANKPLSGYAREARLAGRIMA
ncbi:transposon protein [Alicycliphilus sp. B1]|nr:transposon protein [Alicycliphilus sp. B1]